MKYIMENRDLTVGIGILFMLYGYYRAVNKPLMSVILTILSLGTRVLLAYILRERRQYQK
jgi:Na+-driven multidrug efflux pump